MTNFTRVYQPIVPSWLNWPMTLNGPDWQGLFTTVVFRTTLTRTITQYELLILLSSNNSLLLFSLVIDCFCPLVLVARKHEAMVPLVKEMSALRGHVIMPLHTDSELDCALMCLNTRTCFSFNYKKNKQLCELNHTNKFTSPNDFIWDHDSTYYEMIFT